LGKFNQDSVDKESCMEVPTAHQLPTRYHFTVEIFGDFALSIEALRSKFQERSKTVGEIFTTPTLVNLRVKDNQIVDACWHFCHSILASCFWFLAFRRMQEQQGSNEREMRLYVVRPT
jgi:hypothetical protein